MTAYINQISSLGPKVWYRFNETAGTPVNYGSLSTTSTFTDLLLNEQTDVDGRAVYFNGSTSSVKLPEWPAFSLFDDRSFTTEMWFKIDYADTLTLSNPAVNGDKFRPLFTYISQNGAQSIGAEIGTTYTQAVGNGNRGRLIVTNYIGTFNQYISTETYADNAWHHLVVVNNTTSFKVYVDGVLKRNAGVSASPTSIDMDNNTVYVNSGKLIGARVYDQGGDTIQPLSRFKGRIDEVAIYDRELTSTEITNNFVAGSSVTFTTEVLGTASALMVQPTVSASFNPAAQAPMTASAASGDHYNSTVTFPKLLNTYLGELSLQSWFKFDQFRSLENYGTGSKSAAVWFGDVTNNIAGGIQGYGSISLKGSTADNYIAQTTVVVAGVTQPTPMASQCQDEDFTIGFWVKKQTKEATGGFVNIESGTSDLVQFRWNADGGITFRINGSNQNHDVASSTDITDGEWHFVTGRLASNTMQLWIDNTSIGTTTMNHGLTLTSSRFGGADSTDYISLSQFFISTSAVVTSTEIANIYDYGTPTFTEAAAYMPSAAVKFDSAFNTYIQSKSPLFDFRMDEATGIPVNFGSATITMASDTDPQGYVVEAGLNNRAIKFTDRGQAIRGNFDLVTGTLSTSDTATLGVLFKTNWKTLPHIHAAMGSSPATAIGMYMQSLQNGTLRVFYGTGGGASSNLTGTTDFSDNKWHLAIAVADGTNLYLYVDGKLEASKAATIPFTDSNQFVIAGPALGVQNSNSSMIKYVDEAFATNTVFTAQEAFEAYQALRLEMETTATALMVDPATTLGTGRIVAADPATASGLLVMPTEDQLIAPTIDPMTATALFLHPNYGGNVVIDANYGTTAMTANAVFHDPQYNIGDGHSADHMNATGLMVHPISIAGGSISVNPGIALNATLIMPGIVTIKGALVKAQTLNANAFVPLPPQYFTILDDLWYQRLVAIDEKDDIEGRSIVFFNTSDNFYVGSDPIPGSGWTAPLAVGKTAINAVTNPLPAINGGYFDAQNRKAVNLRNIALTTGGVGGNGTGDADFTFEAMIKTTKSNQVLFAGTNTNIYNTQRTAIILRDGKLALTNSKDRREGAVSANDQFLAFTGFKNIADGEWHHIIIQNKQRRIQFWIDGQLDIQRYGNTMYVINTVGYNSPELNSYSDFTISAFGLNLSALVEQSEINLNYLAAINVVPVKAGVATATATATPNNKGRGNRARALMLYFWPTQNASVGYYSPTSARPPFGSVENNYHNYDQGTYGSDPDTFYQLTTYLNQGASQFYDWDIWPVSVVQLFDGDQWVGESHPILKDGITKGGTDKGTVYVDPVTDNERYLNLMTDLKDLSQFDMICFRNYPDQSLEQDKYGVNAKGVVDDYFNLLDKNLFADFLKSLREAVDTGISLLITNPQLAVDMGFIDTYHLVSDLAGAGNESGSDPYVPIKLNDPLGTGTPVLGISYPTEGDTYLDAYRNNYHQVVNTLEDLTDDAAFIWTDEIFYSTDSSEWGELSRNWSHVEYNDGLQVGDKFLISTAPSNGISYFATPLDAVRAGKVITKFADTYMYGAVERVNPYRNYATSIAVEPGTVVAGKQIGAKVFISFTDVVGIQKNATLGGRGRSIEQKMVSLKTDYWINYAYSIGLLTVEERTKLLADSIDRRFPNGGNIYNALSYWTLNGEDIIGTLSPYDDNTELSVDTSEQAKKQKVLKRTRRGKPKKTIGSGALPAFSILWGWATRNISVPVPSINLRGLWWLSERLEYNDGLPQRPEAFNADGFMKQPVVTGFKTATIAAQPGLAVGAMVETNLRSAGTSISVLPLTATAFFVEKGTFVSAEPATAAARTPQDIRTTTFESDQVVLYLVHVDPILYLREDVIK
jgi:hypothetical protein